MDNQGRLRHRKGGLEGLPRRDAGSRPRPSREAVEPNGSPVFLRVA